MFTEEELFDKSMNELREIARNLKIVGMTKKRKGLVVEAILLKCDGENSFEECDLEEMNKDDLKNILKNMGDVGYSKLTKPSLISRILNDNTSNDSQVSSQRVSSSGPIKALSFAMKSKLNNGDVESKATISCGANSGEWNVIGKSIGQISAILREVINIPDNPSAIVHGKQVDENYIVKKNDIVEYIKLSGSKG